MRKISMILLMVLGLLGCVRDREFVVSPQDEAPDTLGGDSLALMLNEFVARGSANTNEFGSNEDWIELYNPGIRPLFVPEGKVFITDDFLGDPERFALPEMVIPGRGHVVVWADGLDTVATQVHANFKLSSTGEYLGLRFGMPGSTVVMDAKQYGDQTEDASSNGRSPDGGDGWVMYSSPTPGGRNE